MERKKQRDGEAACHDPRAAGDDGRLRWADVPLADGGFRAGTAVTD